MELQAYLYYKRKKIKLSYWQSRHKQEVDFILGDCIAIEVKTTHHVSDKHLKNLKLLSEEKICTDYFLISFDKIEKRKETIQVIHWENFLNNLWADNYIIE